MVPIYSVVSFISYADYRQYVYFEVIRECYEAFAIASFFWLMCHFVAPDLRSQKDYFRELDPIKPWLWPVTWMAKCCGGPRGCTRVPRSGLTWFNVSSTRLSTWDWRIAHKCADHLVRSLSILFRPGVLHFHGSHCPGHRTLLR